MAEETLSWSIWTLGANAMFMFMYVFSISVAYFAGNYILNPIVMGGLAFLIPYFAFTTLPIIMILFTAITKRFLIN
jgi:hypothetical protein